MGHVSLAAAALGCQAAYLAATCPSPFQEKGPGHFLSAAVPHMEPGNEFQVTSGGT